MEQIHYVAASFWNSKDQKDMSLESFVKTGSVSEAKQYLQEKQNNSKDTLKLYKLVEVF